MKLEKLFSTQEASEILNISAERLRDLKHEIGYVKLGSRIYFRESVLESFFETRVVEPRRNMRRRGWRILAPLKRALSCQ